LEIAHDAIFAFNLIFVYVLVEFVGIITQKVNDQMIFKSGFNNIGRVGLISKKY